MSLFGDFEHHLPISVGDYIPNSWVMFNWDIYQPLLINHQIDLTPTPKGDGCFATYGAAAHEILRPAYSDPQRPMAKKTEDLGVSIAMGVPPK